MHNKCNALELFQDRPSTPPLVHGKIVFHKTVLWCQKYWGPLILRAPTLPSLSCSRCPGVSRQDSPEPQDPEHHDLLSHPLQVVSWETHTGKEPPNSQPSTHWQYHGPLNSASSECKCCYFSEVKTEWFCDDDHLVFRCCVFSSKVNHMMQRCLVVNINLRKNHPMGSSSVFAVLAPVARGGTGVTPAVVHTQTWS